MNISLRPARLADEPVIRSMILKNNLNPFAIDWRSFTVAFNENEPFIGCGQIKRHGDLDELASLMVKDDWQGRGASNLLMESLMNEGGRPLWLMCESLLTEYYERYGFEEVRDPFGLPLYFQNIYWVSRVPMGWMYLLRGTHLAFMVLRT